MDMLTKSVLPVSLDGDCHSRAVWAIDGHHLAFMTSETSYFATSQLIVVDMESGERQVLFELTPYPDETNPVDPEDRSLGSIDHVTGWSPSQRYIMVESDGFDPETSSVCIIEVETKSSSCAWKISDLAVPLWLPDSTDDEIGLMEFGPINPYIDSTAITNLEFERFNLFDVTSTLDSN